MNHKSQKSETSVRRLKTPVSRKLKKRSNKLKSKRNKYMNIQEKNLNKTENTHQSATKGNFLDKEMDQHQINQPV